jgi:serine/threonine-protein kinase HipA
LNTRIHIDDKIFALDDGLLPKSLAKGSIRQQFLLLAEKTGLSEKPVNDIIQLLTTQSDKVERMINSSYLNKSTKSNYWQAYQKRLKLILK